MKNFHWICAVALVGLSGCVTTPQTPTVRLAAVRTLVGPGNNGQVTDYLYRDSLQFRDVQQLGGTLVKQGKLPGSSVAVDEKSATLNIGTPLMKAVVPFKGNWLSERRRFTAQATIKGQVDDGFVNLFKNSGDSRGYQRTLSFGLTGNWFMFGRGSSTFYHYFPSDQATLHQAIRERLVTYDAGGNAPSAAQTAAAATLTAQVTGTAGVFAPAALAAMKALKPKKDPAKEPIGNLVRVCIATADATAAVAYTAAVQTLRLLLPDDWDTYNQATATKWITTNLPTTAQGKRTKVKG